MLVRNLNNAPKTIPQMSGAKGVTKQVPISAKDASPNYSFRVFTIEPGGYTPLHSHPFEHLNYVISGQGMLMEGETGRHVRQGDFALVMPGEVHQYRNASLEHPLVLICAVPKEYE